MMEDVKQLFLILILDRITECHIIHLNMIIKEIE